VEACLNLPKERYAMTKCVFRSIVITDSGGR
jgi:hypothetical protein